MEIKIKNLIFLFLCGQLVTADDEKEINQNEGVISIFENSFLYKMGDFTNYVTKMLADYNDRHLGSSEWGKMLGYEDIKPKLLDNGSSRGIKKMSMALMPLIFHVGATSTWMLITSIMAAKSVAIGLLLLVFKIAVSSAKVASFFTLLKSKHADHEHHHHESWGWLPAHHGHDRSLTQESPHEPWSSYQPEWSPSEHDSSPPAYKTIPTYKENSITSSYEEEEYAESKSKSHNLVTPHYEDFPPASKNAVKRYS